ncbi:MAG: prepilin peptidase, partial [Armatimonadota bacterium]
YRLPLGKHLSNPPSTCPSCNYKLTFWDNIPLLSFLFLGARCRLCHNPISWRYFCVELVTACLWTLLYHQMVDSTLLSQIHFVLQALLVAVLVALVFIDLDHFIAPDELTVMGATLGFGRDIALLGLAFGMGDPIWSEMRARFLYLGWIPFSVVGAAVYAGILFFVSFATFVYYAREDGESIPAVARRFFDFSEEETVAAAEAPGDVASSETPREATSEEDGEAEGEAPRLAFSPAFLCLVSTLAMLPLLGVWAMLFFAVPFLLFLLISRRGDPVPVAASRFFRSADLGPPVTGDTTIAAAQDEADQFANEAETGKHGGMGLGDVKLAVGLGAMLGPGLAMLSLGFATAFGAITGIALAAKHGRSLRIGLPFVPFMAIGAIVSQLYGAQVVAWYSRFLNPEPPRVLSPGEVRRMEKEKERAAVRGGSTSGASPGIRGSGDSGPGAGR